MMKEIVVYLTKDYSKNESIFVSSDLDKKEITKLVNEKFTKWFYYDVL